MKKVFSIFSILCFALLGSIYLAGCGASSYTITTDVPDTLILQLEQNEEVISSVDGSYVVDSNAQIVAKIFLTDVDTDYSGLSVKVNDKTLTEASGLLIKKTLDEVGGDLFVARFALAMAKIKKDVKIEITLGGVNL